MPLVLGPVDIIATSTPPDDPGDGIDVSGYNAAIVTISELNDLNDYTLRHYGYIDDQGKFPASTEWPELDALKKTRATSTTFYVPLMGVTRYLPVVTAWDASGGAPRLDIRLRAVDTPIDQALRNAVQLQGLTDIETDRLTFLLEDAFTPRRLDNSFDILAQDGDHIDIVISVTDMTGVNVLTELTRMEVELFDISMNDIDPLDFTAEIIAPGAMNSVGANNRIIGISDVNGELIVRVTDLNTPTGMFMFVRFAPTVDLGAVVVTFLAFT